MSNSQQDGIEWERLAKFVELFASKEDHENGGSFFFDLCPLEIKLAKINEIRRYYLEMNREQAEPCLANYINSLSDEVHNIVSHDEEIS